MKKILIVSFAFALLLGSMAGLSSADDSKDKDTLSEEEVANLVTSFKDPQTGKEYVWKGTFTMKRMNAAQKAQAKLKKKVPYRITGALYEMKKIGNRKVSARQSGECSIVIMDADGKVVTQATKSLDTMCPS